MLSSRPISSALAALSEAPICRSVYAPVRRRRTGCRQYGSLQLAVWVTGGLCFHTAAGDTRRVLIQWIQACTPGMSSPSAVAGRLILLMAVFAPGLHARRQGNHVCLFTRSVLLVAGVTGGMYPVAHRHSTRQKSL